MMSVEKFNSGYFEHSIISSLSIQPIIIYWRLMKISDPPSPPPTAGALESHNDERDGKLPHEIRQMLLVLQNVHRSPPKEAYFVLQQLVGKVVKSYLPMVARSRTIVKAPSESAADGKSPRHNTQN